jgi:hypothetical protein
VKATAHAADAIAATFSPTGAHRVYVHAGWSVSDSGWDVIAVETAAEAQTGCRDTTSRRGSIERLVRIGCVMEVVEMFAPNGASQCTSVGRDTGVKLSSQHCPMADETN